MTPLHIEKAGNKYMVKDDKGNIYGTYSSRQKAQAKIYSIEQNQR